MCLLIGNFWRMSKGVRRRSPLRLIISSRNKPQHHENLQLLQSFHVEAPKLRILKMYFMIIYHRSVNAVHYVYIYIYKWNNYCRLGETIPLGVWQCLVRWGAYKMSHNNVYRDNSGSVRKSLSYSSSRQNILGSFASFRGMWTCFLGSFLSSLGETAKNEFWMILILQYTETM
jgi:Na+-translocating ferredoxin:NAD+ oxidoreductase RnfE subunit